VLRIDLSRVQIHCPGLCVAHGHPGTSTGRCSLALNCFLHCLCRGSTTPLTLIHLSWLFSASPLKGSQDFRQQGVSAGDFVREWTETSFLNHQLHCSLICRGSSCSVCLPISPFPNNFFAHWSVPVKFENQTDTPERLVPPFSMEIGNQQRRTTLYEEKTTTSVQCV